MNRAIVLTVFVLFVLAESACSEESPNDSASWWISKYGVVTSHDDPLVSRTEKVFERVSAAADKKGSRFPKLVILRSNGDPYAQAIKDGSIILTHGGLKICYQGVSREEGDSRLAFVLGHELAHLAKDDFWHAAAFAAIQQYSEDKEAQKKAISLLEKTGDIRNDENSREHTKMKEIQADTYGLIYATTAGYNPKAIINDNTNFFEDWVLQITGNIAYSDSTHPSPKERAKFVMAQLQPIAEELDYFNFGVRLFQIGRYEDAILFFDRFKDKFPGREVFNNLGLSNYQLAMESLAGCDETVPLRFKLSTVFDIETSGRKLMGMGINASAKLDDTSDISAACLKNDAFLMYIRDAVRYLTLATEKDPAYIPARINLSAALIWSGEFSKSMGAADEVLEINPENYQALNNKAVALYLFGISNNIDTTDTAINLLKELENRKQIIGNAVYNIASIQSERGRNASASETWNRFLKIEQSGMYAAAVKKRLGIKTKGKGISKVFPKKEPPFKLGEITDDKEEILNAMRKKPFTIGEFRGEIYENKEMKVLAIDNAIEIIEIVSDKPMGIDEFKKMYGDSLYSVRTVYGITMVYSGFAIDVVDGYLNKIIFFKRDVF